MARTTSKALRVALVGCGGMGNVHARHFALIPEVRVVALCDVVKDKMQRYLREHYASAKPRPATFTSYDRMLQSVDLDAVALVTPHALHHPQTRAALEAGLHVLVEKPMVTSAEHAREIVALAERAKRTVAIAFQAPCSREFAYMRSVLRREGIGRLEMVIAWFAQHWKQPTARSWRHDPKLAGGGALYDTGAHMLNAMMWLVDNPVRRVQAVLDNSGTPVDVNGTVSVTFANGCIASVGCAGNALGRIESGIAVYGTRGILSSGIWGGMLKHVDADGRDVSYPVVPYEELTPQKNFVSAILGHDEVRCPPRYGVLLAELMDAIYESARTGLPADVQHRMTPATKPANRATQSKRTTRTTRTARAKRPKRGSGGA